MVNPFQAPVHDAADGRRPDDPNMVSLMITPDAAALAAVQAAFEEAGIPLFYRPLGFARAVALGPLPEQQHELMLRPEDDEAGRALLACLNRENAARLRDDTSESAHESIWDETARRRKYAYVLLLPLFPFSYVVSFLNAHRCIALGKRRDRSMPGMQIVRMLAVLRMALSTYFLVSMVPL